MQSIAAAGLRLLFLLLRLIPARLLGALGAGLGRAAYRLDRRHRDVALRNLARVYPDRPRRWRRRAARESFAELGRTLFELPHVFLRSRAFLRSRVEIEGEAHFREAMEQGRGVILAACHHGNWELGALMFSLLGYDSSIVYRPLRQPPLERYLKERRERFGATLRSRLDGLRWMPRTLKAGGSVAIMVDQHISHGQPVPFLGHLANTTTLPAAFARKHDIPVIGVAICRRGRAFRFRLSFWPVTVPEAHPDRDTDNYRIMHAICRSFAPVIHERPELWLWSHRRWRILEQRPGLAEVVHGTP